MIIPLLSLALAAASPAPAQTVEFPAVQYPSDTLTPARAWEISVIAPDWITYRNRADRMMARFPAAAAREGWDRASLDHMIAQVRKLLSEVEGVQSAAASLARAAIRSSEPPSNSRSAREGAVTAVFEGRALTLYANLVPRILDEATKDRNGRPTGRRYAGPEWTVPPLTFEEGGYFSAWQISRAGFTPGEYIKFEDRARDSLGLPPRKP